MHRCYNDTPLIAQKLQQNKESVTIRGKLAFAVRLKSHDLPGPHAVLELGFVLFGILGRRGWRRMREKMCVSTSLKSVLRCCVVCSAAWWSAGLPAAALAEAVLSFAVFAAMAGAAALGAKSFAVSLGFWLEVLLGSSPVAALKVLRKMGSILECLGDRTAGNC